MAVNEELDLDITPALSSIVELEGEFASTITTLNNDIIALSSTLADSITAGGQQGAEGLQEALASASETPIEITADTNQATDAVEVFTESVADQDVEVGLNVNVEGNEELKETDDNLEELQETASGSEQSFAGLERGFGNVASAATISTQNFKGFGTSIASVGSKLGPYGIVAAGAATATLGLADAGTEVIAINQRLESTFGSFASQIENIQVGSLNRDLESLGELVASDDEAIKSAASSLGQLAQASGFTQEQSANLSAEVIALTTRAVALNPELGDVGSNVTGLAAALGRGGPKLAKYGLDLQKSEIAARAASNAQQGLGDGVSQASLRFAGAQLAIEKYGASLDQDITEGSENAAFSVKRIGVELGNAFEPLTVSIAKALLPTLKLLQPVIKGIAVVVNEMSQNLERQLEVIDRLIGGFANITVSARDWQEANLDTIPVIGAYTDAVGNARDATLEWIGFTASAAPALEGNIAIPALNAAEQVNLAALRLGGAFVVMNQDMSEFAATTTTSTDEALGALRELADEGGKSIQDFIDANTASLQDLQEFNVARQQAIQEGNQALLDELNRLGPQASEGLVDAVNAGSEAERAALNAQYQQTLIVHQQLADNTNAFLVNGAITSGAAVGTEFGISLNGTLTALTPSVAGKASDIGIAIQNGATPVYDQAGNVLGAVAADGTKVGLEQGRPVVQNAAGRMIAVSGPLLPQASSEGVALGSAIGDGLVSGLFSKAGAAIQAAQQTVDKMFAAANARAQTGSPSKLFAQLGRDIGDGLALGIDQSQSSVVGAAEQIIDAAASAIDIGSNDLTLNAGSNSTQLTALTVQVDVANAVGSDAEARRAGQLAGNAVVNVLQRNDLITSIRAGGRN